MFQKTGLRLQESITTLHSTRNTVERTCVFELKIHQTCNSNNHSRTMGGPIFNPVFADVSL